GRDGAEVLFPAAGETGKGVVLITPGEQCTYADVYEWQPRVGRPFTYPLFAAPAGKHLEPVRLHEAGIANGARAFPAGPAVCGARREAPRTGAAARGRDRQRRAGLPAGHAAAAHDAVHAGGSLHP